MLASAILAAALVTAAVVALWRRRARKAAPALAPELHPLPAGLKHLATTVSDLSDRGLHLPVARNASLARKPRLGSLLQHY